MDKRLEGLFQAYSPMVYRLCLRYVASRDVAEDLTQEVFLKVDANLRAYQGGSAMSTWIYRIAANACLDYLRTLKRRSELSARHLPEGVLKNFHSGGDRELARIDLERLLNQAKPEVREFLFLTQLEGMSCQEAAKVTGKNIEVIVKAVTRFLYGPPGGPSYLLPNLAYAIPDRPALFPKLESPLENVVSEHGGTGMDTYVGVGGKKRFGCGQDGKYLRQGDGWVAELERPDESDAISVASASGRITFRLEGLAGKHVRVELKVCVEHSPKKARANFELLGGTQPAERNRIAPNHWLDLALDTLAWEPIPIPTDPYYLEVGTNKTLEAPFRFAVDGYRILSD